MKNIFMKSLSVAIAILLATMMSFTVLAEDVSDSSEVVSSEASSEATSSEATSSEATSSEATSSEATSSEATSSEATSSEATSSQATSSEAAIDTTGTSTDSATVPTVSTFPWARVITLIVIVVLVAALVILSKTNTALGQKIKKFFKEYGSEIKKVSWLSPKDTAKATGVVLVFIIVAAAVIGLLDVGFSKLIQLLADKL